MPVKRLLVLDDDAALARTVANIAESAGVECRTTVAAEAFFRELSTWPPEFVFLDLSMPGMDGVEIMRQLAGDQFQARLILSSGLGGRVLESARQSAIECGLAVSGVLPKPFRAAALRSLLADGAPALDAKDVKSTPNVVVAAQALNRGLERREFILEYQPKIRCDTGAVAGFEGLVRWNSPELGRVMPDRFIPLAESSGLIVPLTQQIVEIGLTWLAEGGAPPDASLSLNLSARNLNDLGLVDEIRDRCAAWAIDPGRIILEVTETHAMADPATALALLTRLRVQGFHLSLDDFGTGYSSLIQLARMPFSEIKVDRSFVMSAPDSKEARTIIKAVVDLGHGLGLKAVAEGVEDLGTLRYLQHIGCDLAQGYHIARPMPARRIADWLAARAAAAADRPDAAESDAAATPDPAVAPPR